jgi:threonine dehydratase
MFEADSERVSISLDLIRAARTRIEPFVRRTVLVRNATLSQILRTNAYLKLEIFQKTGSFKVRGAFNKVLSVPERAGLRGLVAVSGGNHAQAVAYVARTLGMKSTILMPESTPKNYIEATRGYGSDVRLLKSVQAAFEAIPEYEKNGWMMVHPFDDSMVIAGQGTVGLEVLEDLPEVTDVIASIGGGGFIGGVATALMTQKSQVRIWGVETEGADCMSRSLAAGHPVTLGSITSIARTLGAPAPSARTLGLAQKYLQGVTVVSDAEALVGLRFLLERAKVLTEPAASCTHAAALRLRERFKCSDHVVLVLCGGNVGVDDLLQFLETSVATGDQRKKSGRC